MNEEAKSRIEAILKNILGEDYDLEEPKSRVEALLIALGSLIGNTPQLVDGVLPLTVIPPAAIEKIKSVANDTARFKLTKQDVQNGDTVYVEATNKMYLVIDDTKLNLEAGYKVYMAGRATEAYADELGRRIINTYATNEELTEIADKLEKLIKDEIRIYGFKINPDESDPYEAVTYLKNAVGMTPAKMRTESFDYGSWKDAFFMPRPCMVKYDGTVDYYLNPNNYKLKEDGTPSDVDNPDYEGNAMMEFPKIWFKFENGDKEGEGYFYCSNVKVDNTYHCWCNYDCDDNEIDNFYMAIYNGTGTAKMRSLSGVMLTPANGNGNTTGAVECTRATANNTTSKTEWYTEVWSDRLLLSALHILIGKSLDSQKTFGNGISSGSQAVKEAYVTGSLDDKGMFYGDISRTSTAVKTFGIENFWSLVYHRIAGCVQVDGVLKTKLTFGKIDGSDTVGYNGTGTGYVNSGNISTSNGYARAMEFNERGFMTKDVSGGASNKYYCDYYYYNTGNRYLLVGGNSDIGINAGLCFFHLNNAFSYSYWSFSASLSLKPLFKERG